MDGIAIEPLAACPELLPILQAWFESEWPAYYGAGGRGSAERDLQAYAHRGSLPAGLVAFREGVPCGFVALKGESFPTHPGLLPWAGAAYVDPPLRRQGIGRRLFIALEAEARRLGYARMYCATSTSASLLLRCGWHLLEQARHEGEQIDIFEKVL